MSKREFTVDLIVRTVWSGPVQAASEEEAYVTARRMWLETTPHPFDCCDEELLRIDITAPADNTKP